MRSQGGERDGVQGTKTNEMGPEMDLEKATRMSKDEQMVSTREVKTEITKELRTENSKEGEREMRETEIVDGTSTGFGAAEPEARTEREMLKSAMNKKCLIQKTLLSNLEDK